jgi:hypothetical protein
MPGGRIGGMEDSLYPDYFGIFRGAQDQPAPRHEVKAWGQSDPFPVVHL